VDIARLCSRKFVPPVILRMFTVLKRCRFATERLEGLASAKAPRPLIPTKEKARLWNRAANPLTFVPARQQSSACRRAPAAERLPPSAPTGEILIFETHTIISRCGRDYEGGIWKRNPLMFWADAFEFSQVPAVSLLLFRLIPATVIIGRLIPLNNCPLDRDITLCEKPLCS